MANLLNTEATVHNQNCETHGRLDLYCIFKAKLYPNEKTNETTSTKYELTELLSRDAIFF